MSEPTCIGTPVSWLRLERLALGELPREEERVIQAHLDECAACRACADECRVPVALLPLRRGGLHTTAAVAGNQSPLAPPDPREQADARPLAPVVSHPRFAGRVGRARWLIPVTLVAAAAALALVFLQPEPDDPARGITRVVPSDVPDAPRETVGATDAAARADGPSLVLLRERSGAVVEDPRSFLVEDRFAIQLTCRPGQEGQQRVAVYQDGEWSLPLETEGLRCGNRVRVPGAFRLTESSPADICVLWGETAQKAATASAELAAPAALREAACQRVEPVALPPALR